MTGLAFHPLSKRVLHALFGDYQYWKVFAIDLPLPAALLPPGVTVRELDPTVPLICEDEEILARMSHGGDEALGFGLYEGDRLVAVQWYWWGDRYVNERKGRSWHLPPRTAKSHSLYTVPACRGKGYADLLKRHTAHLMSERGFTRLYSRIWHSHKSSVRVSEKAGWKHVGNYIEICPFAYRISFRINRSNSKPGVCFG